MAKKLQLRRGTTSQHSSFTGAVGEVTVDTDKDVIVVHDGSTAGGFPSVRSGSIALADLGADCVDGTKIADDSLNSEHYIDGSIDLQHLSADCIDGTKIADDSLNSEHYIDGSIDLQHLSADCIDGTKIADDSLNSEHYIDGSIDLAHLSADCVDGTKIADDSLNSEHYVAGSIDLEHMSSESVDEDNLHISNAGSNGQFLSKQSGNTGGLTWASAGDAFLATDQSWTGSQRATLVTDNDGSFDMNAGQNFKCTPSGNFTLTFTNFADGQSGFIILVNSGGHTVALHGNSKADANLATTVTTAGTYILSYISDGTNSYLTNSAVMA